MKLPPASYFSDDSAEALGAELVRTYFQDVFRWLLLVLDDPELAVYASLDAILAATLNAYALPGETSSRVWVFRQAARQARRTLRGVRRRRIWGLVWRPGRQPVGYSMPETYLDAALWLAIDQLPDEPRLAAGLAWGLGQETGEIAQILEQPELEIDRMLAQATRGILDSLSIFDLRIDDLPEQELDQTIHESLARRYNQLQAEPLEVEALAREITTETKRQANRRYRFASWKEYAWLGVLVALILGLFWVVNLLLPEPQQEESATERLQSAAQATSANLQTRNVVRMMYFPLPGETVDGISALLDLPPGEMERLRSAYPDDQLDISRPVMIELGPSLELPAPTPVAPLTRQGPPLTMDSSPDEVRALMNSSSTLWTTLWLDSVYFNYRLAGFTGRPQTTRVQAWFSQPDMSLSVIWSSSEDSTRNVLYKGGMVYFVSPAGNFQVRHADSPGLYLTPLSLEMVYPNLSEIFSQPGQIQIRGKEEIAGREALVIDWSIDERGIWPDHYRLWVDTQVGIILRCQFFASPISDALLGDVIFAHLDLDVNFPQPDLFSPYRLPERVFVSDYRGEQVDASVLPVLPATPVGQESWPTVQPGRVFDPAKARLSIQYPENSPPYNKLLNADVFAGTSYLGQIVLSDPEEMICVRSQDGQQLAYSYDPYGNPDIMGIGWFRLEYPIRLNRAEIPLVPVSLAFSPDGRYLAYFASPLHASPGSLAVIDTLTGRQYPLVQLIYATSLIWGPDGKSLAMVVSDPEPDTREVRILDVDTKQYIYRHKVSIESLAKPELRSPDWPAPDWPARSWGVDFPVPDQHLADCLLPRT